MVAGMVTAMMATAAAPPAALCIRRRRRSLRPARSALRTTGPIGGLPARALSSSPRSDVSSMPGIPCLLPCFRRATVSAGFGGGVAQHAPQLIQCPGALALHRTRRAAKDSRHLVYAQVRPVPQHHACAALGPE